jgi:DNA-binding NarL/FixJ family response regulator
MRDVLLVDDHPVIRALIRQILEAYPDIVIVAEAEDGENAVQCAIRLQPTIALIDCHLPRLSGVEVTKLIKIKSPGTAIIGLTAGEPNGDEMQMVTAGAAAILNKADVLQHLYPLIVKSCAERKPQAATITPGPFNSVPLQDLTR